MRTRTRIFIVVGQLVACIAVGFAGQRDGDILAGRELPAEIRDGSDVAVLGRFLDGPDDVLRAAAARKLGRVAGPEAVDVLVAGFDKEPYTTGVDAVPYVKQEIVESLKKIGGEKAKEALLNIASAYWKRGPQCGCEQCGDKGAYPWHDGDYLTVAPASLKALRNWKHDKAVVELATEMTKDKGIVLDGVRRNAWELYLRHDGKEGIVPEPEFLAYLVSSLEESGVRFELGPTENGIKRQTEASIKSEAVSNILKEKDYGESELSGLREQRRLAKPGDNRYNALAHAEAQILKSMEARQKGETDKGR